MHSRNDSLSYHEIQCLTNNTSPRYFFDGDVRSSDNAINIYIYLVAVMVCKPSIFRASSASQKHSAELRLFIYRSP